MSRASGLQKLVNAPYKRICPGLCPTCVHLNTSGAYGGDWYGCDKLDKRLSNPHTTPGRCSDYEQGEQKLSDEQIQDLHDEANEMQASKKARREKRTELQKRLGL
jgi:hypothetical protein